MNKNTSKRKLQHFRKKIREAHLSPEIRDSFKAINQFIEQYNQARKIENERKKNKGSRVVRALRRRLIILSERQNHRCCYCGVNTWHPNIIDYEIHRLKFNKATVEHLLCMSQGGTHRWSNLVMACSQCNTARGTLPIEEFLYSIQVVLNPETEQTKVINKEDIEEAKIQKTKRRKK